MSEPTPEEGRIAIGIARETLETSLGAPYGAGLLEAVRIRDLPTLFREKRGLFVTLLTHPGKSLRGCIGFIEPVYPLGEGIVKAAWLAAREDHRFPPVGEGELPHLVLEVSVLGPLERIRSKTPDEILSQVVIGRDGLVISEEGASGLLLPQVPVDEGWNAKEFLSGVCVKAGLPPSAWMHPGPLLWRFGSRVFSEDSPGGKVFERPFASTASP